MSRAHDVLFKGPMIRAILDGSKTQTRRVITDRNSLGNVKPSQCDMARAFVDGGPSPAGNAGPYLHAPVVRDRRGLVDDEDGVSIAAVGIVERIYSRWNVGDRLHVRETIMFRDARHYYAADESPLRWNDRLISIRDVADWSALQLAKGKRCVPGIHMPRWACRLVLEITELRIEPLQSISEADAMAEGVPAEIPVRLQHPLRRRRTLGWGTTPSTHREAFAFIWDLINGKRDGGIHAWAKNEFVRAFTFSVVESPTITKAVA